MITTEELFVVKRNGKKENVSFDKVLNRLRALCNDKQLTPLKIDSTVVAQKVCSQIYPGVTTTELDSFAAQLCASMVTTNTEYEALASRIVISNHHKNTSSSLLATYDMLHNHGLIRSEIWEIVHTNVDVLQKELQYHRDYLLTYFGFKTLEKSYLLKIKDKIVERPQHLWLRVSLGIYGKDISNVIRCYHELSNLYYTHATPTLFNSGTPMNQLASCFLMGMKDDSILGIYETLQHCALISKYSGGIGLHIHDIRGIDSCIKGTNGKSNGIIPMLKVFNDTARYVDQGGGKRNGSFAMYIEPWHCDIFEFLQLRKNHGDENARARDLFYALWIPDLFMKRVQEGGLWSLMSPDECPNLSNVWGSEFETLYERYENEKKYRKQVPAIDLWSQILIAQIETGTPYLLYKDACNRKSNQQNLGTIRSSNLCTEIIQYSDGQQYGVCNLASINLSRMIKEPCLCDDIVMESNPDTIISRLCKSFIEQYGGVYRQICIAQSGDEVPKIYVNGTYIGGYKELISFYRPSIDFELLGQTTRHLVRNLNAIIDTNFYPLEETRRSNLSHRPIGIGVQGFADLLLKCRISFTDKEAFSFNEEIFACMYYHALSESCEIAKERKQALQLHHIRRNEYDSIIPLESQYCGAYSSFIGSPMYQGKFQFDLWEDNFSPSNAYPWHRLKEEISQHGIRNSLLIAPMPTASTSQILGNHECFEPIHSNIYLRRTLAGEFIQMNKYLMKDLMDLKLWNMDIKNSILLHDGSVQHLSWLPQELKEIYKTVWEIPPKTLIDMAIRRGHYICQSQSMNLFINQPTIQRLTNMHFYTWKHGLKTGIYYLRTQSASKAQPVTIETDTCINCSA